MISSISSENSSRYEIVLLSSTPKYFFHSSKIICFLLEKSDVSCYYNVFSNGMGTYLVLDLSKPIDEGGVFWSKDELPESPIPFWDYVDEWIILGLDF